MTTQQLLNRIEINPKILVGKPVIRGTRLSVGFILGLLAHGMNIEDILEEYPSRTREDILACLAFAEGNLESSFAPSPF